MLTTLLLVPVLALGHAQEKLVFRDQKLGVSFEYPKGWKLRKERYASIFEIPMEGGAVANVQIFSAKFKGQANEWQLIQEEISRSMNRTVERQWQEEFLGVPMLFTKVRYTDKAQNLVVLTGLLYSAYEDKLHFRLTAPAETADQIETSWKESLLTLRTVSGDLPTVEDPNKPAVKPEPPKPTKVWKPEAGPATPVRGTTRATLVVEATTYTLYLPDGWSLHDGKLTATGLAGSMEVRAAIGLPEDAGRQLVEESNKAMESFTSVSLREDPKPTNEPSGTIVGRVFRTGTTGSGPLVLGHIVGYCEGVYFVVTYKNTDPKLYKKDLPTINTLTRLLYAERQ